MHIHTHLRAVGLRKRFLKKKKTEFVPGNWNLVLRKGQEQKTYHMQSHTHTVYQHSVLKAPTVLWFDPHDFSSLSAFPSVYIWLSPSWLGDLDHGFVFFQVVWDMCLEHFVFFLSFFFCLFSLQTRLISLVGRGWVFMGFPERVDAAHTLSNPAQCQTGCTRQSSFPLPLYTPPHPPFLF